jgi:hypothetical protein
MLKLTGLWASETKNGDKMLAGKLSPMARIVILPNKFKKNPTDPDYYLFIAAVDNGEKREDKQEAPAEAMPEDVPF